LAWWLLRRNRGRLWIILICVALAVGVRASLGGALVSIEKGIDQQSRLLLGADLQIVTDTPLEQVRLDHLTTALPSDITRTELTQLVTMATSPEAPGARPVQLKAVPNTWPLYGSFRTEPPAAKDRLHSDPQATVVVRRDLLLQMGLEVGQPLRLGQVTAEIIGVVTDEPGLASGAGLGPTVILGSQWLPDTALIQPGSRVSYRQQVLLPDPSLADATARQLRQDWGINEDRNGTMGRRLASTDAEGRNIGIASAKEAQASVRRFLARFGDILRLVALGVSLVAALGVGSLLRSVLIDGRTDSAVLQVHGLTPRQQISLGLWQAIWLSLIGSLAGMAIGALGAGIIGQLVGQEIELTIAWLDAVAPGQLLWAALLGTGAALLTALPTLVAVAGLPPATVLRAPETPPPTKRWWLIVYTIGLTTLGIMVASFEARSWVLGSAMIGGTVAAGAVAWLLASLCLPLVGIIGQWLPVAVWRLAARNLARYDGRPTAAVVSMVMALFLQAILLIHSESLSSALARNLDGEAPSIFAIDIQPYQVEDVQNVLAKHHVEPTAWASVVRARLIKINGAQPDINATGERERERAKFFQGREQNLSWRDQLGPSEQLIAGNFPGEPGSSAISLEETMAENIGAQLGDVLTFSIQGIEKDFTVTSLRSVDWLGMQLNFFMLVTPGSLDGAPRMDITTLPPLAIDQRAAIQRDLALVAPNVTTIDVSDSVQQANTIISTLLRVVYFLAGFGAAAALIVLAGLALADGQRRQQETALLRALGASDQQLNTLLLIEFSMLGLLGASLGLLTGAGAAWLALEPLLEIRPTMPWLWLGSLLLATVVATVACGYVTCRKAIRVPPTAVLSTA
jgi:putative ABC transport system permease protein